MKYFICFFITLYIATVKCYPLEENRKQIEQFYDELEKYEQENNKVIVYDLNDAHNLFEKYIKDYNKSYENMMEYQKHFKNFVENLKYINEVNSSGRSSVAGINALTDLDANDSSKELGDP